MMLLTCYISSQFFKLLFLVMSLAKYITVQNFVTIMSTGTAGFRVSGAPSQLWVYRGLWVAPALWAAHVPDPASARNYFLWLCHLVNRHLGANTLQRQPYLWCQCGANAAGVPSVPTTTGVDEPISVINRIHEFFLFHIVLLHMVISELSASLYCISCKYTSNIKLQLPTSFLY